MWSPPNRQYKPFGKMIDWGVLMGEITNGFGLNIQKTDFLAELKENDPEFFEKFYASSNMMSG